MNKERKNKHIALLMDKNGLVDSFGDPMSENHGMALSRYFSEHQENGSNDKNHFLPKVLSREQVNNQIFKKDKDLSQDKIDFNEYDYANYLIKVLNDMGYIFIKDYSVFETPVNIRQVYIPSDISVITDEQIEALKEIYYNSYNNDILVDVVSYKDYQNAVNDMADIYNINELLYSGEEEDKLCISMLK